jgi:hypothetical protein
LLLGQSLALTNGRAGQSSMVGLSFGFFSDGGNGIFLGFN